MRAVIVLFITVIVAFASVSAYAAGPGAEVKSSPLFKRSLEETVALLEGEIAAKEVAQGEPETIPTGVAECEEPLGPITSFGQPSCDDTCQPTGCGGECYTQMNTCTPSACGTCAFTCSGTCAGQPTCSATCPGWSTCASTCVPGACNNYHFYGTARWRYLSQTGINWREIPGGIIPYYYEDGHGVYVKFDGESSWTRVDYISYDNGYYSGYRLRTTTSAGANIQCSGAMTCVGCSGWWGTASTVYRNGPLPTNNYVNFEVNVVPF